MRAFRLLLVVAALLGASPALADVTARYVATGNSGPPLVVAADGTRRVEVEAANQTLLIEADDAGRVRVEAPSQTVLILGADAFIVHRDERGSYAARIEDHAAVSLEFLNQLMSGAEAQQALARIRFETREGGSETVGQWRGTLYTLVPVAPDPAGMGPAGADESMQFVVSDDPSLRALGPAAARAFLTMTTMVGSFMPPDMTRAMREVFARGAPLRINRAFRLESVSDVPIAADRFAPPANVLSREQLRQRMPGRSADPPG